MGPVNAERLALLDACEAEAGGGPVPLEEVLDAFVRPVVEMVGSHAHEFVPLIGRLYTEPGEFCRQVLQAAVRTCGAPVRARLPPRAA